MVIPLLISCKKDIIATFDIHIENLDRYDESEHELYKLEIYRNNKIFNNKATSTSSSIRNKIHINYKTTQHTKQL